MFDSHVNCQWVNWKVKAPAGFPTKNMWASPFWRGHHVYHPWVLGGHHFPIAMWQITMGIISIHGYASPQLRRSVAMFYGPPKNKIWDVAWETTRGPSMGYCHPTMRNSLKFRPDGMIHNKWWNDQWYEWYPMVYQPSFVPWGVFPVNVWIMIQCDAPFGGPQSEKFSTDIVWADHSNCKRCLFFVWHTAGVFEHGKLNPNILFF